MSAKRLLTIAALVSAAAFIGYAAVLVTKTAQPDKPSGDVAAVAPEHAQHQGMPAAAPMTNPPAAEPTAAAAHGGHNMAPVDASGAPTAPPSARGGQPLVPRRVAGVNEYDIVVGPVQWHILPDVKVAAYAYNGTVPGPQIREAQGTRLRIAVTNNLPEPTTIHWHGLVIPNDQDGVPELTQAPILPGATFTYDFTLPDTPGTYFYHSHFAADRQQPLGLYGALIIDDPAARPAWDAEYAIQLNEITLRDGRTFPAMAFEGMFPNYFTINGKSYPATERIRARVGQRLLFRFVGSGQFIHPMHIHGGPFEIVATDGNPVPAGARLKKDVVLIGPGERYDVIWTALKPGKWLLHCHINHHITNDGAETEGGGGMTMLIEVTA